MENPLEGRLKVEISSRLLVAFLVILVSAIIFSVITSGNAFACLMPKIYMWISELPMLKPDKCDLQEGYFFRLTWVCLFCLTLPAIVLIAINYQFPKYSLRLQLQQILPKCILPKIPSSRRPLSIKVCTSANKSNVQQLIEEISSRFECVDEVRYYSLPYNDLDSFSFPDDEFDVIILCHSIDNRRFVITDVMDSLYNKFLANAENSLGKEKVCVIAHDFPEGHLKPKQKYEDQMMAFRIKQPSTFKHSNLTMMVGRLDRAPAELSQDQWNKLHDFIDQAEVAGSPFVSIHNAALIASLIIVILFVPALIKNKYMVVFFDVIFVTGLTLHWPRLHLKWSLGIWLAENALSLLFQWSPYSFWETMLLSGLATAAVLIITFMALFDTFYIHDKNIKRALEGVVDYIKRRGGEGSA